MKIRPMMKVVACLALATVACAYGVDSPGFNASADNGADAGTGNSYGYEPPEASSSTDDSSPPVGEAGLMDVPDAAADSRPPPPPPPPPPSDSGTCTLALQTGIPQCDTCLGQSCCAPDNTCGQDQNCQAFIGCGDNCVMTDGGDAGDINACLNACAAQYPTGANELSALDSCMQTSCATPCGM